MSSEHSYTVQDWLELHQITKKQALELCQSIRLRHECQRRSERGRTQFDGQHLQLDMASCIENIIVPAFSNLLGTSAHIPEVVSEVEILALKPEELQLPYTTRSEATGVPSIRLVWRSDPESLVTLAGVVRLNRSGLRLSRQGCMLAN